MRGAAGARRDGGRAGGGDLRRAEAEIASAADADERPAFLESAGPQGAGPAQGGARRLRAPRPQHLLHRGREECRAWTIKRGAKAPQAAGVIHTDFERGFIKAEVIWWEDLVKLGSEAACRDKRLLRVEGKEYVVRDGDVMHFRFNV